MCNESSGEPHVTVHSCTLTGLASLLYLSASVLPGCRPSWHRHLGPATLAAALFMVVVALWKLVLSKDGPTRLEKVACSLAVAE